MAATGYLFLVRLDEQKWAGGRKGRQGLIIDIRGQEVPQPLPVPGEPPPDYLPPIPTTKSIAFKPSGSAERKIFAIFFVKDMTQGQYVKHEERLHGLRITKQDFIAMMGVEADRNLVRRTFDPDQQITLADLTVVTFAAVRAVLRDNRDDSPVELED